MVLYNWKCLTNDLLFCMLVSCMLHYWLSFCSSPVGCIKWDTAKGLFVVFWVSLMSVILARFLYAVDNISALYLTHTPVFLFYFFHSLFIWYSRVECHVLNSCFCITFSRPSWQLCCVVHSWSGDNSIVYNCQSMCRVSALDFCITAANVLTNWFAVRSWRNARSR